MTARRAAGFPSGQEYAGVPRAATSAAQIHLEQEHEDHHLPEARDYVGPRAGHHLGQVTPYETWGRQARAARACHPRTPWDG